jgi:hypothetical protein
MQKNLLYRGIVIIVIFLFISLAFAPSFTTNITNDSEKMEIATKFSGKNDLKQYTV